MYLILFDMWTIRDANRYYYRATGAYYHRLIQATAALPHLDAQKIEEILIYSSAKEDEALSIKTAKCSAIRIDSTTETLEIEYANIQEEDITCKDVKNRLYHFCIQHEYLVDGKYTPNMLIVDDIQLYTDIKIGRLTARYVSMMSQLEAFKKECAWLNIVKLFPNEKSITSSEYWNDIKCLSDLSFALAKLTADSHSKKQKYGRNLDFNPERFFLLVSDRCIELDPGASEHLSVRAYYYYELYLTQKKEDHYKKACDIYEQLVQTSAEWYKEKYRFTKLQQTHYECNFWNEQKKVAESKKNIILQNYQELVDQYNELDDDRKKRYNKLYIRSLFGYASFSIDKIFTYWDDYVQLKLYDKSFSTRIIEKPRLDEIVKVEKYLSIISTEKNFDNLSQIDLQDKPNYLEVQYRFAQIEQSKGIVYVMKRKEKSEYVRFFEKSNEYIEKLFVLAKRKKQANERFNYPHYAKLPKAINLYFLGQLEQCHQCFYNAREYMIYEQGCIYALCQDFASAERVLQTIPENNTCYKKAQKLIQRIQILQNEN